ncbi:hypothetical protein [Pedobacter mendelii]|uniref:Uncharacterized protein n=1 Tax=Pedobacter mendelii TaxID=1908240 RepID=A0ABQ2BLQ5_9SPHI|nr:hypothetical protein [Pedobacter mendelii]GGI27675.1 hypothetical protein GCM10008119_28830 [Pedobacter mendelii]
MAVLHKKEEKIQAVLGRLSKKYTDEQFVEMFIKLYSKDWGKIKSAYIKQSQDKEPGTVINMPKPEIYLKQVLANYLNQVDAPKAKEELAIEAPVVIEPKKAKASAKKKVDVEEEVVVEPKKAKAPAKKKVEVEEEVVAEPKKAKASAKKKVEVKAAAVAEPKKVKAPAKKKTEATEDLTLVEKKPKAVAKKPAVKK